LLILDWQLATTAAAVCLVIGFIVGYALRAASLGCAATVKSEFKPTH
jgi:hypothetical protein